MKKEEFDLTMAFEAIKSMREAMDPYMNEYDKKNFDYYSSEPYTESNLKALKSLIVIVEEESGHKFSQMMWRN